MRTHLTVVPADQLIIVDGQVLRFAFPAPSEIHAVQWHAGKGHIEYKDGSLNRELGANDYAVEIQPFVALWEGEKARLDAIEEAERNRPPTLEEAQKRFTDAIQGRLDAFARTRSYDGILSATTYATSTAPQFKAEGQYAVEARDMIWAAAYVILDAVLAGERPMPSLEELFQELPELKWPDNENSLGSGKRV